MSNPQPQIVELWRQIHQRMHEQFRHLFRDIDMPPMVLILLRQIAQEPGVTVSELARRSNTVKSHVSKLIDQLVKRGALEKRVDPADQRLVRIYMTQAAKEKKTEMEARAHSVWGEVMANMSEHDAEQVHRGLRILLDALEKTRKPAPDENPDSNCQE